MLVKQIKRPKDHTWDGRILKVLEAADGPMTIRQISEVVRGSEEPLHWTMTLVSAATSKMVMKGVFVKRIGRGIVEAVRQPSLVLVQQNPLEPFEKEIFKLAAQDAILGGPFQTPEEYFFSAEVAVLHKHGRQDLLQMNSMLQTHVVDFDEKFRVAYAEAIEELSQPAVVVERPTEGIVEKIDRIEKILLGMQPKLVEAKPIEAKPVVKPVTIVLVGLLPGQVTHIENHPPIAKRLESGWLKLDITKHNEDIHVGARGTIHAAIVFITMVSHPSFYKIRDILQRQGQVHIDKVRGIHQMRVRIIDRCVSWEREHSLR